MNDSSLKRLRILSIAEILYLPILMVPSLSAVIVVSLLQPISFLIIIVAYCFVVLFGGSLASSIFSLFRRKGTELTIDWRAKIAKALVFNGTVRSSQISKRIKRARLNDLTVGAFVQTSLRAQIVASGGLLVQLLRGDRSARAIIAHEYAHIQHADRLYFMILLLYFINLVLAPIYFIKQGHLFSGALEGFLWWAYNVAITTLIVSQISVRRELSADFAAARMVGQDVYIEMLNKATGTHSIHERSFFHPSLHDRKEALTSMKVCNPSKMLLLGYALILLSYLGQAWLGQVDRTQSAMAVAQAIYCGLGIALELSRGSIREGFVAQPALTADGRAPDPFRRS